MKKLSVIFSLVILFSISRVAAQDYSSLLKNISDAGSIRVEYAIEGTNDKGIQFIDEVGTVEIQDSCYRVHLKSMEIYCNGTDRWLFSPISEELVIMKNDMKSSNPMDNPLMFLTSSEVRQGSNGSTTIDYKGKDGSSFKITILKAEKVEAAWEGTYFVLDTNSLSDNVIITDLR